MTRVWRNGWLVPGDATPGVFAEDARLFETLPVRGGKVQCLDDHLARLGSGLDHLGLPRGPLAAGDLAEWRRAYAALGGAEGVLRLVVGPHFEELSLRPHYAYPLDFRLCTLRTRRDDPEWHPRPKSAPWANSLAAIAELRRRDEPPGAEGVLLDARGYVSECSRSNLAWVLRGRLKVPAASTGRLPGTALAQLILCADIPVDEVESPPPIDASGVLVLRSTLPGGSSRASHWVDADNRTIWDAFGGCAHTNRLRDRLADHRAQRSVSLA